MSRILAVLSIFVTGCTLFAIGAGVYADREYKQGIGVQDFRASIQDTWQATRDQMDELGIKYNEKFQFDFEKGSHVPVSDGWVEVKPHEKDHRYTRVRARFSGLGSQDKSRARAFEILDGVDARLGGAGSPE